MFANDAAQKAFRRSGTPIRKTDDDIFPPPTAAVFKANDQRVLLTRSDVQVIETLAHEDGTLRHSIVSKFPISGPDGETALVAGMAIDITDRLRRIEESLKMADRQKDEFLAMFAHELRNPLAPYKMPCKS